ncbi:MAG: SMC-Scp complex subunit ScpB [Bacteroidota bacterium]|nr:SMC-Scp complex subunit ScpB [Bacteroidota bacterium]
MELSAIIPHIEALIFASDKPLTALDIVELINNAFGFMEERISLDQIEAAIEGICEKYSAEFYPFEVKESGGGFQFLTRKAFYKTVALLNGEKFLKKLSNAALETLAIIAYKQPITKGEVEAIRGVNSDYSVQKLLEKELIMISGRNEELPGKPLVYSTSKSFMDYFGINSTDDQPKIKEVLAEQSVQGTLINDAVNNHVEEDAEIESNSSEEVAKQHDISETINTTLIVADTGELIEKPLHSAANEEGSTHNPFADTDEIKEDNSAVDKGDDKKTGESSDEIKPED